MQKLGRVKIGRCERVGQPKIGRCERKIAAAVSAVYGCENSDVRKLGRVKLGRRPEDPCKRLRIRVKTFAQIFAIVCADPCKRLRM